MSINLEEWSSLTLIESPIEVSKSALLPGEALGPDSQCPHLLPQLANTPKHATTALFSQSRFTSVCTAEAPAHASGVAKSQDPIFTHQPHPPTRKSTLQENFEKQALKIRSGGHADASRALAKAIFDAIHRDIGMSLKDATQLAEDPKMIEKIAKAAEDFMAASLVKVTDHKPDIDFITTHSRLQTRNAASQGYTLDFYDGILPVDLRQCINETRLSKSKVTRCIAKNRNGKRCKNSKKFDDHSFDSLMSALANIPKPRDFSRIIETLLKIADSVVCTQAKHLKHVRYGILKLYKHFSDGMDDPSRDAEIQILDLWLTRLAESEDKDKESVSNAGGNPGGIGQSIFSAAVTENLCANINNGEPTPAHADTGSSYTAGGKRSLFIFDRNSHPSELGFKDSESNLYVSLTHKTFKPYEWPDRYAALTPKDLVTKLAIKDLSNLDINKSGKIYVYRHVQSFGFCKIGLALNVNTRLDNWEKQCSHLIDEQSNLLADMVREAPHPARLEKLIHAELKEKRWEVLHCELCRSTHQEWFRVDSSEAQRVVRKWTEWMQDHRPYNEAGKFRHGEVELPAVGDCETVRLPLGPKFQRPRGSSERRVSRKGQQSTAARGASESQSVHHMVTRSQKS